METCPRCGYSEAAKKNKKFGTEMAEYTNPKNLDDKSVFASRETEITVNGVLYVRSDSLNKRTEVKPAETPPPKSPPSQPALDTKK